MSSQPIFSLDLVQRVNRDLIERRRADLSTLPPRVQDSVNNLRFTRQELTQAFTRARQRVAEAALHE